MTDAAVDQTRRILIDKYGELGQGAAERLQEWVSGSLPYTYPEVLLAHCRHEQTELLFDAFWQLLPFGTGGRRGRVGYGSNRVNHTTAAMTIQGHCQYLLKAFPGRKDLSVVVANDVRVFSDIGKVYGFLGASHPLLGTSARSLAKLACEIYTANGITAYLNEPTSESAVLSTPELSFFIEKLGSVGGVNFSASHNPPDDNGLKIYDPFGSQPVAPDDQNLLDVMRHASKIERLAFDKGLAEGRVKPIPVELQHEYLDMYVRLFGGLRKPNAHKIVYTPLCGCGLRSAGALLDKLQFPVLSPPDEGPDGRFPVIPFRAPNPEVPQSTEPARAFADKNGSGIVLSSDPDVDRIGVEIKLQDGSWFHFDGNQIASVLAYYLMLDPQGPRRKGLVIETLVTTKLVKAIAEKAGCAVVDDILVGFKYVADILKQLDKTGRYEHVKGRPEDLILATEESHGVMMLAHPAEKDSAPGCMYIAALYQRLAEEKRTLLDYYYAILEELGAYDVVNRSLMMVGAEGMMRIERIMTSLRKEPPKIFGGQEVRQIVDHWDAARFGPFKSESDKLPRNVLEIMTDRVTFAVRPSGTEPKLKFYCQLKSEGPPPAGRRGADLQKEARAQADHIALITYNDLLGRIGLKLDEASLLLPDIIDFNRKQDFQEKVTPRLREAVAADRFAEAKPLLDWLRGELTGMLPGDPLPATKASVLHLCRAWKGELGGKKALAALEAWARE
jgi:phosphoglucomutase/phosphomannomutase